MDILLRLLFAPPPLAPPPLPWAAPKGLQHSELFLFLQCFFVSFCLAPLIVYAVSPLCVAFPFCRVIFRMLLFNGKANRKTKTKAKLRRPKMQTDSWIIAESEKLQIQWTIANFSSNRGTKCGRLCVSVCVFVFEHIDWHFNVTCIAMAAMRA